MIILTISYLLNIIDYIFTAYWVNLYGISIEGNPLGWWMFENNVAFPFKTISIGAAMFALYICTKRKPKYAWTSWLVLVVYGMLTIYHIVLLNMCTV